MFSGFDTLLKLRNSSEAAQDFFKKFSEFNTTLQLILRGDADSEFSIRFKNVS